MRSVNPTLRAREKNIYTIKPKRLDEATVAADSAKLKVGGRDRRLNRTVVELTVGGRTIELATWYEPGQGIVQQEQRTGAGHRDAFTDCCRCPC